LAGEGCNVALCARHEAVVDETVTALAARSEAGAVGSMSPTQRDFAPGLARQPRCSAGSTFSLPMSAH
jgi:hypothetical protein